MLVVAFAGGTEVCMRSIWTVMALFVVGTTGCRSGDDKPLDTGVVDDTQVDTQTETGSE